MELIDVTLADDLLIEEPYGYFTQRILVTKAVYDTTPIETPHPKKALATIEYPIFLQFIRDKLEGND